MNCPLCGTSGYQGLTSFKCDNVACKNGVKVRYEGTVPSVPLVAAYAKRAIPCPPCFLCGDCTETEDQDLNFPDVFTCSDSLLCQGRLLEQKLEALARPNANHDQAKGFDAGVKYAKAHMTVKLDPGQMMELGALIHAAIENLESSVSLK